MNANEGHGIYRQTHTYLGVDNFMNIWIYTSTLPATTSPNYGLSTKTNIGFVKQYHPLSGIIVFLGCTIEWCNHISLHTNMFILVFIFLISSAITEWVFSVISIVKILIHNKKWKMNFLNFFLQWKRSYYEIEYKINYKLYAEFNRMLNFIW